MELQQIKTEILSSLHKNTGKDVSYAIEIAETKDELLQILKSKLKYEYSTVLKNGVSDADIYKLFGKELCEKHNIYYTGFYKTLFEEKDVIITGNVRILSVQFCDILSINKDAKIAHLYMSSVEMITGNATIGLLEESSIDDMLSGKVDWIRSCMIKYITDAKIERIDQSMIHYVDVEAKINTIENRTMIRHFNGKANKVENNSVVNRGPSAEITDVDKTSLIINK